MHRCSHPKKLLIAALFVACGAALALSLAPGPAWAQGQELIDVVHPGGLTHFRVGMPTIVSLGTTSLTYWTRPAGRFQLLTGPTAPLGGDPTRTGDENKVLVGRAYTDTTGYTGYTDAMQFSIDQTTGGTTSKGVLFDIYSAMDTTAVASTPAGVPNWWPIPLAATTRGASGTALLPIDGKDPSKASMQAYQNFQMVGDVLMIEVIITNTTTDSHKVGLHLVFDTGFGGTSALGGFLFEF